MPKKKVLRAVVGNPEYKKKFKNWTKDLGTVPELDDNFCVVGSTPIPEEYDPEKVYKAIKSGGVNGVKNKSGGSTRRRRGRPPKDQEEDDEDEDDNEDDEESFVVDESFF